MEAPEQSGKSGQTRPIVLAGAKFRGTGREQDAVPWPLRLTPNGYLGVEDVGRKTKLPFSASTDGRGIKVVATSSTGTAIHTTPNNRSIVDEVYLYANNTDTSDRKLTIEFGGTSSPDDLIEETIAAESGIVLVVPGWPLRAGLSITAFCASANVVIIRGYVLRGRP